MADFSKEWCEEFDPDMPHDFSIKEEFDKLNPEECIGFICEGYGFIGIEKTKSSKCILLFNHPTNPTTLIPVPLEQLSEYSKKRYYCQ